MVEMVTVLPPGIRFDGCALITGFHGIGAIGYWTVKHMAQRLKADRVAFIDDDVLSPAATTSSGRLVTPCEIYRKGDVAFFKVEVPPYGGGEAGFYKNFAKWVMEAGFTEVALVGGLDSSLRVNDTAFRLVRTKSYTPRGDLAKAPILEDDRMIVGPVAILLNYFEMRDFPAFALLAYASTDRVDQRAAATAISVLSKYYRLTVDIAPLIKGAEALESEVTRQEARGRRPGESIYT